MRALGHGRIIVIASGWGVIGHPNATAYAASKSGLIALTKGLGRELGPDGILANAIAPMAATRMTADIAPQDVLDLLPAAHVSPVVGYLMTEESEENGSVFVVGGGQVYRVAQFQNPGVVFAKPPTVEEVADNWDKITDMSSVVLGKNPVG